MNKKNINNYICVAACFSVVGIILMCCFYQTTTTQSNVSTRYCVIVSNPPLCGDSVKGKQFTLILPNNKTSVICSSFCPVVATNDCEFGTAIWTSRFSLNSLTDLRCTVPPIDLFITGAVFIFVFLVMMVILFLHPYCRNPEPRVFPVFPGILAESV